MPPSEHSRRLELPAAAHVVLILDMSQSASAVQPQILEVAGQVLQQLPAKVPCSLYFLGNSRAYDARSFSVRAAEWAGENAGRLSVLAPVLETLVCPPHARAAVLGSGPIYDLEDWREHPLAENLLLASWGEPLQATGEGLAEQTSPAAADILRHLINMAVSVRIAGSGFLPLEWSHPGYRLDFRENCAVLWAKDQEEYSLQVRFLSMLPESVRATVEFSDGRQSILDLASSPRFGSEPVFRGTLTEAEAEVFRRASKRSAFRCPHCQTEQHRWDQTRCPRVDPPLGRRIFDSLPEDLAGVVLFRETPQGVQAYQSPSDLLLAGDGSVLVRSGGRARVLVFNRQNECWEEHPSRRPENYIRWREEFYVVLM